MEYNQQCAILQSAMLLAEKFCDSGTLETHTKKQNVRARMVVKESIEEVIEMKQTNQEDPQNSKLEILVLMVLKALKKVTNPGDNGDNSFDAVTVALPDLSWQFLFDVIKDSDLWMEFCYVLPNLNKEVTKVVIHQWFKYFLESPDESDKRNLVDVIGFLGLTSFSPFYASTTSHDGKDSYDAHPLKPNARRIEEYSMTASRLMMTLQKYLNEFKTKSQMDLLSLIDVILTALEATKFEDGIQETQIKLGLSCLLLNLGVGHGSVLSPIKDCANNNSTVDNNMMMLCSLSQKRLDISSSQSDTTSNNEHNVETQQTVDILVSQIQNEELPVCKTTVDSDVTTCFKEQITRGVDFINKFPFHTSFSEEITSFNIQRFFQDTNETAMKWLWMRSCKYMIEQTCNEVHERGLSDIQNVAANLVKCVSTVETSVSDRETDMETSLVVIKHRLRNWKNHLHSILNANMDVIKDPRWIQTLDENQDGLMESDTMIIAIKKLSEIEETDDVGDKYRQLIVRTFRKCDLKTQNDVLEKIAEEFGSSDLEDIFEVDDLKDSIRLVFNRVTHDDNVSAVNELSALFLQSPEQVLQEILNTVIHNKGQIQAFAHIFHQLPALMKFGSETSCEVPVLIINALVGAYRSNNTQGKLNLLLFCKQLMKPYSQGSEVEQAVLNPTFFLEKYVLPNVLPSTGNAFENLWCKLVLTIFEVLENEKRLAKDDIQGEPIVWAYAVFANIDSMSGNNRTSGNESRENWLKCAEIISRLFEKFPDLSTETEFLWLYNRLLHCHWTTVWRSLVIIMPNDSTQKLLLPIPEKLFQLMNNQGRFNPITSSSTDPILSLLELASITDRTLGEVKENLDGESICNIENVHARIVVCLATLLPISTGQEWIRLFECVTLVLQNGNGMASYTECLKIFIQTLWTLASDNSCLVSWNDMASSMSLVVKHNMQDIEIYDLAKSFLLLCNIIYHWPDQDFVESLLPLGLELVGHLRSSLDSEECLCELSNEDKDALLSSILKWVAEIPQQTIRSHMDKALSKNT